MIQTQTQDVAILGLIAEMSCNKMNLLMEPLLVEFGLGKSPTNFFGQPLDEKICCNVLKSPLKSD